MRRRITMLVMAALLALTMSFGGAGAAFAKQAQEFERGKTTTHQGNSTNSPVVSCHHGSANSNGSAC